REQVVAALRGGGYGAREMVIRINPLDSPWGADDLRAVAGSGADAICLPKVDSAAQIEKVARELDWHGAPATMAIWAMIETARGVLDVRAIAASHPRLKVLALGTSDLGKELRLPPTPERTGF